MVRFRDHVSYLVSPGAELRDQDVQRRNHVLPGEAVKVSGRGTRVLCRGGLHAAALLVCDRVRQAVRFTMT